MKKIYSFVLMATMLLIGTNAWANVHPADQASADDEAKVKIGNGEWQYARYLKEAFDAVGAGQTAEIELLKGVNLTSPINMPALIPSGGIVDVLGQNITLNLAGYDITADQSVTVFRIMKGALDIQGRGNITKSSVGSNVWKGQAVIAIFGTEDSLAVDWSKLTVGKDVTIEINPSGTSGTGIIVQDHNQSNGLENDDPFKTSAGNYAAFKAKFGYGTWDQVAKNATYNFKCGAITSSGQWQQGSAFGVKIFVDGTVKGGQYGIQITGHVNQKPDCMGDSAKRHPEIYPAPYYKYQYPYIKVSSTGSVASSSTNGTVGIYASGYGIFDIHGQVEGATGLYMKASDVDVTDAYIRSTSNNPASSGGGASGVKGAGGSAIVMESNDAYAGGSGLSITGDTRVEGNGGYAIFEETYKENEQSTTTHISIEGGTIQGGKSGAIAITVGSQTETKVTGGNINTQNNTSTITVGQGTAQETTIEVSDLFPNNGDYHTTEVVVNGKTTVVVSEGEAPATADPTDPSVPTSWEFIADASADSIENHKLAPSFAWTKIEAVEIPANETVILNELLINSGKKEGDVDLLQQLTINNGATLQVERLTMNDFARIIVKAGGKLIVKGSQGIVAGKVENIKLENEETTPAIFLFNPAVTSNRHPKATVEFTSKGFNNTSTGTYGWQKFGVPTQTNQLLSISIEGDVPTAFGKFNYETPAWEIIGYLNHTPALNLADLNQAFEYYQMEHNTATVGTKVTFKGSLVGNDCPAPVIRAKFWNGYANSYSAPIDGAALLAQIPAPADKAFYLYEMDVLSEKFAWVAKSNLSNDNIIQPMQPFLVRNANEAATALALDYESAVYNPAITPSNAPARRNDMTKVEFIVRGENGVDHVIVAQDDQFSAEFDNGYDVAKYMNDDVNMYVSAEEKMAIYATDNLENTYIGIQTISGGNYTIEFAEVQGEKLTLIDHETNACVAMVAGSRYEFTTTANSVNDYRFEIVASSEVPTAIENTEAVKSAKGIYTITGQYVGEMNVWNTLPAGVYVINGEKRVK